MTPLLGWFFAAAFVTAVAIGLEVIRALKQERAVRLQLIMLNIRAGNQIAELQQDQARAMLLGEIPTPGCDCERCEKLREGKGTSN